MQTLRYKRNKDKCAFEIVPEMTSDEMKWVLCARRSTRLLHLKQRRGLWGPSNAKNSRDACRYYSRKTVGEAGLSLGQNFCIIIN